MAQKPGSSGFSLNRRQLLHSGLVIVGFTAAGGLGTLLTGCSPQSKNIPAPSNQGGGSSAPAKDILIGSLWARTGAAAAFSRVPLMVVDLFLEEFNKGPGIKSLGGAKFKFIASDFQSNPEQAATQAERLIQQGASLIIGTGQSAAGALVTQTCERLKVPALLTVDIAADLTKKGYQYTFRVCANSDFYVRVCTQYLDELSKIQPISKVAIMHADDVFGTGAGTMLEQAIKASTAYKLTDKVSYAANTQDFSSTLRRIQSNGAEVLLMASYPADAVLITRQMREIGFNPKAIVGAAGGHKNMDYIKNLGPLADGTMAGVAALPDMNIPTLKAFNDKFVTKYKEPLDENGAYMLTALYTLADVFERAGSTEPEKVRQALAATDLKVGSSSVVTLPGVKFDSTGQNQVDLGIMQIQAGKQVSVYPTQYASGKVVFPKPVWP